MTDEKSTHDDPGDPGLEAVMGERRQLINLAYRLLGSLSDAEDAVQETYVRWYAMPPQQRAEIESPGAWLSRVAGRICLDALRSARARRERYVGEWIPEPVPEPGRWVSGRLGGADVDPADRISLDESVSMAFLVVLESMTPAERVSFVLHDVFRYTFAEVAEIVGRTSAACRQLASSARRKVSADRTKSVARLPEQELLVKEFRNVWESGDVDGLVGLLDPTVTMVADGGGRVSAFRDPIEGSEQVAQRLVDILHLTPTGPEFEFRTINRRPGLLTRVDGVVQTVFAFDISGGRIARIWAVRNPEKLGPWL